jgi:hypothetical protein
MTRLSRVARGIAAGITALALSVAGAGQAVAADPLVVLSGHISRASGADASAVVFVHRAEDPAGPGLSTTDVRADDSFVLPAVVPGDYVLRVSSDEGGFVPVEKRIHVVASSTTVPTITVDLGDPVTGIVRDRTGRPAEGVWISGYSTSGTTPGRADEWQRARSGSDGRYVFPARAGWSYDGYVWDEFIQEPLVAGAVVNLRRHVAVPTSVTARVSKASYGRRAVVTARVTPDLPGGPALRGELSVMQGRKLVGTSHVARSGTTRSRLSSRLTVGTHHLKVVYGGGPDGAQSGVPLTVKVVKATPSSNVVASDLERGSQAKVRVALNAPTAVRGVVTIYVGGAKVGSARLRQQDGRSTATVTTRTLTRSGHVTVTYSGSTTIKALKLRTTLRVR